MLRHRMPEYRLASTVVAAWAVGWTAPCALTESMSEGVAVVTPTSDAIDDAELKLVHATVSV